MKACARKSAIPVSWRRLCRIGLDGKVPHPTTLMKLTTRCGEVAVAGLSTLAPVFAVAFATHQTRYAFLAGLATAIGAGVKWPSPKGSPTPAT